MPSRQYRSLTWVDPRQQFRSSPIHGTGAFASEPIAIGEIVEIFGGSLMTERKFRAFQRTTPRYNATQIAENRHLVERPAVTEQRAGGSLNHSCDSNLWMADDVTLVARRAIEPDEELTVDYALFTAQPDWVLDHECQCGAPDCRKTVTGNDWRLPAVQQRYYPHFSPFLNRRIERLWARQNQLDSHGDPTSPEIPQPEA